MTNPEEVEAEEERRRQSEIAWERCKWEWTSPQELERLEKINKNKD